MLNDLKAAHDELLGSISDLEAVLAEDRISASNIARVRLQLSKASARRRRLVAEAIQRISENASADEMRRLNALRENDSEIAAASSSHIGQWTIEAILTDAEGYRTASAAMRKSMRDTISMEKNVLYAMLENMDQRRGPAGRV